MSQAPLQGIRVVNLGWIGVGPITASDLADLGAEVIKVESRKRIDAARAVVKESLMLTGVDKESLKATEELLNSAPIFHNLSHSQKGITVNIAFPKGVQLIKELVKRSDIVIENFSPGVLRRAGLDYESLKKIKPDIIMLSESAAGQEGPLRDMVAFDHSLSSFAGLDGLIGYQGKRVLGELAVSYSDRSNPHFGAFAILTALWYRQRRGVGQYIDMAQLEATVGLVGEAIMEYVMNKRVMGTQGNYHPTMAPHGNYPCKGKDKWVAICVGTEEEWKSFCEVMGNPDLAKDERFSDRFKRLKNWQEIDEIISKWSINYTHYGAAEILQRKGVPAAPVLNLEEMEASSHLKQRGVATECDHPTVGKIKIYKTPIRLTEFSFEARLGPFLGEHNRYVFGEILGMSDEEIDELIAEEVIY